MPTPAIWKCISGDELADAYSDSTLASLVPKTSGLYVWRRRIASDNRTISSPELCREWLHKLADCPTAVLGERQLSHCVAIKGLSLGGGGLTDEKDSALSLISGQRRLRERTVAIMTSLTKFMPPIYIGETNNFRIRVRDHLRGDTGLKQYVESELMLKWHDLEFHYHELSASTETSDEAKRVQELLELIAQRALAPFGTVRPG